MKCQALVRLSVTSLMLGGLFLETSAVASAEEVYTATLVQPRGLREAKTAELTVTVEQFSTEEDAARLRAVFEEQGSDGLIRALREMSRGVAQIQGGQTSRIHHVRVHEGQGGGQVIIVTEQPLYFPGDRPIQSEPTRHGTRSARRGDRGGAEARRLAGDPNAQYRDHQARGRSPAALSSVREPLMRRLLRG